MPSARIAKVNSVVLKTLGKIILEEIDLPKGVFLTLTRVYTDAALQRSEVYFSVLPTDKKEMVEKLLNQNIYRLQQALNQKMDIKRVPKIIFIYDQEENQAFLVEKLLDRLEREDS